MNLIIDIGNTRAKIAVFKEDKLIELSISTHEKMLKTLKEIIKKNKIDKTIISNVSDLSEKIINFLQENTQLNLLSHNSNVPFENLYKTPKTLGLDRIVLMSAATLKFPNKNVLVIDVGTCITYDAVNKKSEYYGGAISPGINMRYNALNIFTSKLPKLEIKKPDSFIGNSTNESLHSGVVNGVVQEIDGIIKQYKKKYLDLTVVLTGGDTIFLSKQLKSSIFANQNFLLEGLNELLIFNNNK